MNLFDFIKKLNTREKAAYSIAAAMTALFLCVCILCAVLFSALSRTEDNYSSYRTNSEIKLSELEKKKNELKLKKEELENSISLAEKSRDELQKEIVEVQDELSSLKQSMGNTDELYKKLNTQLSTLKSELEDKNAEIESLYKDVEALKLSYGADVNSQYELLKQLYELIDNPPKVVVKEAVLDANGKVIKAAEYKTGSISIYYEDIERGHVFKHEDGKQYLSSGCLESAFALSVLDAASKEMDDYNTKLEQYIAVNGPTDELPDFKFKYNMNTIFTLTKDNVCQGSGLIKDSEEGTEYTHSELFMHLLKYSDETAYNALKTAYGTVLQNNMLTNIGTQIMKTDPANATAYDLSLVMKEIYDFCKSDAEYSSLMRNSLNESVHNVMIKGGIPNKEVVHEYGWENGAYHDMAVVYDTHPYVLVIMTDMSSGGDEVNKYIQDISKLIDGIHEGFYK